MDSLFFLTSLLPVAVTNSDYAPYFFADTWPVRPTMCNRVNEGATAFHKEDGYSAFPDFLAKESPEK